MVTPRNIRFALALLVTVAIIGIIAAISIKGSRTALPEPVSKQLPHNIDVALQNARFIEMREGVTLWELLAVRAEYDKTGDIVYLSDVRMNFSKTRTNGTVTVTATKGEYSNLNKNVRLRGSVHVVSESGMSFDTESLDYLAGPSKFHTVEQVNFNHDRLSLSAKGMELDVKSETSRFLSLIDAVVDGNAPR
jgi:LPS export ABC transporter protein LptC